MTVPLTFEGADSKKRGGRKGGGGRWEKEVREVGGMGRDVGDRGPGSGRGEICKMGENCPPPL